MLMQPPGGSQWVILSLCGSEKWKGWLGVMWWTFNPNKNNKHAVGQAWNTALSTDNRGASAREAARFGCLSTVNWQELIHTLSHTVSNTPRIQSPQFFSSLFIMNSLLLYYVNRFNHTFRHTFVFYLFLRYLYYFGVKHTMYLLLLF